MKVPEGTKIFSEDIEIGGKSMAERKKIKDADGGYT
jgi:hypothetical protein